VTLTNGGAYSPPQYNTPPPPPPWWQTAGSAIWNTLSGVAGTTGLTKVISVVWSTLAAAAAYVGEAATWLYYHLGIGKLANQFAAGLKALASAMVWALNQVLNFVASMINSLIQNAFEPFWTETTAYASHLAGDVQAGDNASSLGARSTDAATFWSDFGGPILMFGLAIAIVIEVVLVLVMGLTLGAGFLLGILIGIIVSTTLQGLEHSSSVSTNQLSSINELNSQAVTVVEVATNSTNPPDKSSTGYIHDFGTLAYDFGWVAGATTTSLGWDLMWSAFLDPNANVRDVVFGAVSFAVGVAGLAVDIAAVAGGSQTEKRTADVLGGVSFALDVTQLATSQSAREPPLSYLNYVTLALDGAVFLISVGSGP
jgi:hypothetical protein